MTSPSESKQAVVRHKRNLVCVLLDCSESMGKPQGTRSVVPIAALNEAVDAFLSEDLISVGPLKRYGEVAVGSFSGSGEPVDWKDLSTAGADDSPPFFRVRRDLRILERLVAAGQTPMGTAILDGLKFLEARRQELDSSPHPVSIPHRPSLFLVTDGRPEGESTERLDEARDELQRAERDGEVLFWSLGTDGADMTVLRSLSVGGAANARDLSGLTLRSVLRLISQTPGMASEAAQELHSNDAATETDLESAVQTYTNVDRKLTAAERAWYASERNSPFAQ